MTWPSVDLGPLFEPPSVPVDTSETAARGIAPHCGRLHQMILDYLTACAAHGATEREIEQALHLSGNTVRPRLWELEGNAPAGKRPLPARIRKMLAKRGGMRVYEVIR